MSEAGSSDYYETITDCELVKISKIDFEILQEATNFWSDFVKNETNEHLTGKLERVKYFQVLTAKERYLKFIDKSPKLALNVSVAGLMEFSSKISGKEPQLQRHYLDMFYGLKQDYDITKSKEELDFNPKLSKKALIDALEYLKNEWEKK
jgi:dihydroflavonol-4-reductase